MNKIFTDEHLKAVRGIIGAHLKRRREEKGITQEEMAKLVGVSYPTISKIELGRWNFSLDYLLQYCHHLDMLFFIAEKDANDPLTDYVLDAMNMKKNQDT